MKTRKSNSVLACLTILIVCIASFCFTGCRKGVRINEKNFPDDAFRNYLIKKDHDGNEYFSADQIALISGFEIKGCDNLEGIEFFDSIRSLTITDCKDLSAIESVTGLRVLKIVDCKNVAIDFSKLVNLERLTITNSNVTVDIELSDFQKVTEIKIEDSTVRNLTLNNCAILDKVYLHRSTADTVKMDNCPCLDSFTASEVQNLSSVEITKCPELGGAYFSDCPELSELVLRECTNLCRINIYDCDGVKEVDVRGCKYIWEVFNTPDALAYMVKTSRPEYVIFHTSYEPEIKELNLPEIHIECLPDVEFITR